MKKKKISKQDKVAIMVASLVALSRKKKQKD